MDPDQTASELHDAIVDLMVEHGYSEDDINNLVAAATQDAESQS